MELELLNDLVLLVLVLLLDTLGLPSQLLVESLLVASEPPVHEDKEREHEYKHERGDPEVDEEVVQVEIRDAPSRGFKFSENLIILNVIFNTSRVKALDLRTDGSFEFDNGCHFLIY